VLAIGPRFCHENPNTSRADDLLVVHCLSPRIHGTIKAIRHANQPTMHKLASSERLGPWQRSFFVTITKLVLMLACLMAIPPEPKEAKVTPLLSKALTDFPGKEGLMITVEYPPGSSDPIHRHNAHAFVYVLEGSIVMQVKGGKEVTLTPGQTFYEGPTDVHVVGRNASKTKPAKFVVFLIKNKDAPVLIPTSD
jgi:quercetin dioxygenase-like cupin family protein